MHTVDKRLAVDIVPQAPDRESVGDLQKTHTELALALSKVNEVFFARAGLGGSIVAEQMLPLAEIYDSIFVEKFNRLHELRHKTIESLDQQVGDILVQAARTGDGEFAELAEGLSRALGNAAHSMYAKHKDPHLTKLSADSAHYLAERGMQSEEYRAAIEANIQNLRPFQGPATKERYRELNRDCISRGNSASSTLGRLAEDLSNLGMYNEATEILKTRNQILGELLMRVQGETVVLVNRVRLDPSQNRLYDGATAAMETIAQQIRCIEGGMGGDDFASSVDDDRSLLPDEDVTESSTPDFFSLLTDDGPSLLPGADDGDPLTGNFFARPSQGGESSLLPDERSAEGLAGEYFPLLPDDASTDSDDFLS
jgi:hypothetical protein